LILKKLFLKKYYFYNGIKYFSNKPRLKLIL